MCIWLLFFSIISFFFSLLFNVILWGQNSEMNTLFNFSYSFICRIVDYKNECRLNVGKFPFNVNGQKKCAVSSCIDNGILREHLNNNFTAIKLNGHIITISKLINIQRVFFSLFSSLRFTVHSQFIEIMNAPFIIRWFQFACNFNDSWLLNYCIFKVDSIFVPLVTVFRSFLMGWKMIFHLFIAAQLPATLGCHYEFMQIFCRCLAGTRNCNRFDCKAISLLHIGPFKTITCWCCSIIYDIASFVSVCFFSSSFFALLWRIQIGWQKWW